VSPIEAAGINLVIGGHFSGGPLLDRERNRALLLLLDFTSGNGPSVTSWTQHSSLPNTV
jgi:hypothetical protein